jgi:predicted nucleic acid-binding protein
MRIYLDTCSLNRPWDDQAQVRIHLEAEAVIYIIDAARRGMEQLITSDYLLAEILRMPDPVRTVDVMNLIQPAVEHVPQDSSVEARAMQLAAYNVTGYDALHLAAAEAAQCDFLLTTDDRLIKRCARAGEAIHVKVLNPVDFQPSYPKP